VHQYFGTDVRCRYCKPILMDEYIEQYTAGDEGTARAAAKRLTAQIERELVETTINAPNW
jgi:glycerol-3-phosphate O-acyltransferase / dihydroxyacetone phosphate acyltransferase